ncbi:transposase [Loktanella sp. DSM 29012]|nr:transposase [Loktanella sp. DSM 29012]
MDGLAACIHGNFNLDPFSGAIYVFRSRRADRLKLLIWDGSGLVLITKRLVGRRFTWPKLQSGPVVLSKVQFDAMFEGIDWTKLKEVTARKPVFL